MASDQQVTARLILQAMQELERRGVTPFVENLEKIEPDLAEYVIEGLSGVHKSLLNAGLSVKQCLRIHRQVQNLVFTTILAMQKGHLELWQKDHLDERMTDLLPGPDDPSGGSD